MRLWVHIINYRVSWKISLITMRVEQLWNTRSMLNLQRKNIFKINLSYLCSRSGQLEYVIFQNCPSTVYIPLIQRNIKFAILLVFSFFLSVQMWAFGLTALRYCFIFHAVLSLKTVILRYRKPCSPRYLQYFI